MLKQEIFYLVASWGCVTEYLGLPAELNPQMSGLLPDDMGYYTSRRGACQRFFTKIYSLKNSIVKCNNFLLIFLYILSHHNKAVNIHSFVGSLL